MTLIEKVLFTLIFMSSSKYTFFYFFIVYITTLYFNLKNFNFLILYFKASSSWIVKPEDFVHRSEDPKVI